MSSRHRHRHRAWSDWEWSEEHAQYRRHRINSAGLEVWDYEFGDPQIDTPRYVPATRVEGDLRFVSATIGETDLPAIHENEQDYDTWSEWEWSEEHAQYRRHRINSAGLEVWDELREGDPRFVSATIGETDLPAIHENEQDYDDYEPRPPNPGSRRGMGKKRLSIHEGTKAPGRGPFEPFQCHCSQRFSNSDALRQHAQTVHQNSEIPQKSLALDVLKQAHLEGQSISSPFLASPRWHETITGSLDEDHIQISENKEFQEDLFSLDGRSLQQNPSEIKQAKNPENFESEEEFGWEEQDDKDDGTSESTLVTGIEAIRHIVLKYLKPARTTPRQRSVIACISCQRRKQRCSGADQDPEGRCSNCMCAQPQRECIFIPEQSKPYMAKDVETAILNAFDSFAMSSAYKASFEIDWDVKLFMKEQFGDGHRKPIGSIITLTGSALYSQADVVSDYLQRHWGNTVLLDALQQAIQLGHSYISTSYRDENLDIMFPSSTNPAIQKVIVSGSKSGVVSIAQQLAWLGCALRSSTSGHISRSRCVIGYGTQNCISIKYLEESLDRGEESCWHALFANPVIAYGFPISERYHDEKGLEIPIRMMAALGGASQAAEFEGGVLIKGFSSMFVPLHSTERSIQWHYIRNQDDSRLPYWEVNDRCPGRALLDNVDYEAVKTKRSFLGWWCRTTSHLGTVDADYGILDWSDTKESTRIDSTGDEHLSHDPLNFQSINFSVGQKDGNLYISRTGPYQRIINHASRTPIVLYDTEDKRAWLVPSSAVIAHITQARHHRIPFSINDKTVEFISTDPTLNVQEGAERMLLQNAPTLLQDDDSLPGIGGYRFRDMTLSIWSLLENLADRRAMKDLPKEDFLDEITRTPLKGWEFMDLVQERSPIRLKETTLQDEHGGWIKLVQDLNATVFFASGFANLITPDLDTASKLCQKWQSVPKGNDYLTAGIFMLNVLYEEAGSRATKKHLTSTHLRWSRGTTLFEQCSNTSDECTCDRIQQIVQESQVIPEAFRSAEVLEEAGAVIFGKTNYPTRPAIDHRLQLKTDFRYSGVNRRMLLDDDSALESLPDPEYIIDEPNLCNMHTWPSKQKFRRPANFKPSINEELASNAWKSKKLSGEQGSVFEEPRLLQRPTHYQPLLEDPECCTLSTPEVVAANDASKDSISIPARSNSKQTSTVQPAS